MTTPRTGKYHHNRLEMSTPSVSSLHIRPATIGRAEWTTEQERFLCEELLEIKRAGRSSASGFKRIDWQEMKQLLQEEFNVIYSVEMIKSKHNRIKKEYRYFRNLKAKSGLGWNEKLDRIEAPDDVWDALIMETPGFARFREQSYLLKPIAEELFDQVLATGQTAMHPPFRPRASQNSVHSLTLSNNTTRRSRTYSEAESDSLGSTGPVKRVRHKETPMSSLALSIKKLVEQLDNENVEQRLLKGLDTFAQYLKRNKKRVSDEVDAIVRGLIVQERFSLIFSSLQESRYKGWFEFQFRRQFPNSEYVYVEEDVPDEAKCPLAQEAM